MPEIDGALKDFQLAVLEQADKHVDSPGIGYTHLQPGQPIVFAHHLMAYVEMAQRDRVRFATSLNLLDELPLGSGAVAGVPYPIDRRAVADELGFSRLSLNSVDAVSDRDFVIDVQSAAAVAMMHLSRLAEEIVIWVSAEFGTAELDDAFATGSSIMPQKKNPDVAELVRGRSGRVYGNLLAILATMKGLPLSYNRDMQEDKEGLVDSIRTLLESLEAMTGLVRSTAFRPHAIPEAALATDYADYLVGKGLPFADAHSIVGRLVALAESRGVELSALTPDELSQASPLFTDEAGHISVESSLAARDHTGGTAPARVREAVQEARRRVEAS
jgi:argininosuccinate lyase